MGKEEDNGQQHDENVNKKPADTSALLNTSTTSYLAPSHSSTVPEPSTSGVLSQMPASSESDFATDEPQPLNNASSNPNANTIPPILQQGIPMIKVTARKTEQRIVQICHEQGQIRWESNRTGVLNIENVRELRFGAGCRHYRELFKISSTQEPRWITIIFIDTTKFKALHLIALSDADFQICKSALEHLCAIRKQLMAGIDQMDKRSSVWLRQHWKLANSSSPSPPSSSSPTSSTLTSSSTSLFRSSSFLSEDTTKDSSTSKDNHNEEELIDFNHVLSLCKKLYISASPSHLQTMFDQADTSNRQLLDFSQFQTFVKLLKTRTDIETLFNRIIKSFSSSSPLSSSPPQTTALLYSSSSYSTSALSSSSSITSTTSSSVSDSLDQGTFIKFMRQIQKSKLSQNDLVNLHKKYSSQPQSSSSPSSSPSWNLENFSCFLLSSDNPAIDEKQLRKFQDMTRPLNEYFINSSHNTYLTGSQLTGESSPEGYIRALQQGARCVELDVWNGPNGEPIVFHGHTLTSKITVKDALQAIAKYAFVISAYPVILSFELHCDTQQQDRVAQLLVEILGDALLSEPLVPEHRKSVAMLPSPEQLRWKILIKAKDLFLCKELEHKLQGTESAGDSSSLSSSSESDFRKTLSNALRHITTSNTNNVSGASSGGTSNIAPNSTRSSNSNSNSDKSAAATYDLLSPPGRVSSEGTELGRTAMNIRRSFSKKRKDEHPMSLQMVAMLVYIIGVKCRGFNKKEVYAPTHCVSLSERRLAKMIKNGEGELIAHTRAHLVRTYPGGIRVSSTNFSPHNHWIFGCQMAALNWQTFDIGAEINNAFFMKNGRTGYVLKPDALRFKTDKDKGFLARSKAYVLDIEIISGQQLTRLRSSDSSDEAPNPYVEVEILAPRVEPSKAVRKRTKAVEGNGFNPNFDTRLQLPVNAIGDMLDLVFVRVSVIDEKNDDNLGRFCTSLATLNWGYRHMPLYDDFGQQFLFSSLFLSTQLVAQ